MQQRSFPLLLILFCILPIVSPVQLKAQDFAGNPIIKNIFTADPATLVYRDTLYVFTGRDEQIEGRDGFVMREWHVFSTTNMVNWTSHGVKLRPSNFSWASGNAFAGDVVQHNGKFWWYAPMTHRTIRGTGKEGFAIGVAVADHPLGPYTDAKGSALITDNTPNSIDLNIDPAVYIDNGVPHLFWGSWNACRRVRLKDNMIELDEAVQNVTASGTTIFEAPWVHKRNNTYYLSYAIGYPSTTGYATSTSILGPWTHRGVINSRVPNCETNHQAIIQFKGNWYFIYHTAGLPTGGTYRRSFCVDQLEYNTDGTIKPIVRTTTGVPRIVSPNQLPTVALSAPANNTTFTAPASVTITATASDPDGSITRVEFFNGTTKLGERTSSPYTYTWSNISAGTYSITARATDNTGATAISAARTIIVQPAVGTIQIPTISSSSPPKATLSGKTLTISTPSHSPVTVSIINLKGEVIHSRYVSESSALKLTALASRGTYLLKVQSEGAILLSRTLQITD